MSERTNYPPLYFTHLDPTSSPTPSGHAHCAPSGVGKHTYLQPPLFSLQGFFVSRPKVDKGTCCYSFIAVTVTTPDNGMSSLVVIVAEQEVL